MDELIEQFSLDRVSKAGAKFDPEKTKWFNQQYLRKKSDEELAKEFQKSESRVQNSDFEYLKNVCRLVKEKAHFQNEFWSLGNYFFIAPDKYDTEVIKKRWNEQSAAFIKILAEDFKAMNSFKAAEAEATFKSTAEKTGINTGQVMQLFRVCISGVGGGPALWEVAELLGKDEVAKRLEAAVNNIKVL